MNERSALTPVNVWTGFSLDVRNCNENECIDQNYIECWKNLGIIII